MTSNNYNLNEEQQEIYFSVQEIIVQFDTSLNNIESAEAFDRVIVLLTDCIFNKFKSTFDHIKDAERYRNAFLSVIRFKQDELLQTHCYSSAFYELKQLDGRASKSQHFFDTLLVYCQNKEESIHEISQHVVQVQSFLLVYDKIRSHKLNSMTISPFTVQKILPLVTGDACQPYRKGVKLVELFNSFGFRDIYDENGLPDIGKPNQQRPSRTEYTKRRLLQLAESPELPNLLNQILKESEYPEQMAEAMKIALAGEPISIVQNTDKTYTITGGIIINRKSIKNEAHFKEIQSRLLNVLDGAKVSIRVAMAWFTNEVLRDKLLEKVQQGIDVYVAIYDDGINKKHGVNLLNIPHKVVKGTRGGIMHNKFCVIDNQIVVTGSYNWSTNAETKNDENITVMNDPEQASNYSVKFRELLYLKT